MKLRNLIYVFFVLVSFSSLFFTSCTGMNDIIQEYLDRGEINYIGKTDSIYTVGGKERVTFKWLVNSDPRIEKFVVEWLEGEEKHTYETEVDRSAVDDKGYVVHHMDMPGVEGTFIFKTYHTGELGYQSIPSEVTGTVYADNYASKLKVRGVQKINLFMDKAIITWEQAESSLGEKVEYIDNDGNKKVVKVNTLDTNTELPNAKAGSTITIYSIFVPEVETRLVNKEEVYLWDEGDEFLVSNEMTLPNMLNIRDDSGTVCDFSSEEATGEGLDNGKAKYIIDNNPASFWHSQWNGTEAPLPHHLTIDMQGQRMVKEVTVAKRVSNPDLKTCHIEISLDGSTWTPFGEPLEFEHTAEPNSKTVVSDTFVPARYVKLVITESHRPPFVAIGEVSIYGKVK